MKTKIAILLLIASAAGISLQAAQSGAAASPAAGTNSAAKPATEGEKKGDEVIAKGKGVSVTRAQLNEAISELTAGAGMRGQSIPRDQIEALEPQLLEKLITMELFKSKATEQDKKRAKELVAERIAEIKERSGSSEALETRLKQLGMSMADLEAKLGDEAVAEAVIEAATKPQVSDADVQKFYDENPAKFEAPEQLRASHILIMTKDQTGQDLPEAAKAEKRKLIDDILKKARAGEDFAALAKKYSEDPGSKDKGGEYTFPRGQMVPEFEKAAFALKTNEISDVVTTQYGYHIIKLSEKLPAKRVPLSEVSARIKDALKAQQMQKGMGALIKQIRADADVKILDAQLNERIEQAKQPLDSESLEPAAPKADASKSNAAKTNASKPAAKK